MHYLFLRSFQRPPVRSSTDILPKNIVAKRERAKTTNIDRYSHNLNFSAANVRERPNHSDATSCALWQKILSHIRPSVETLFFICQVRHPCEEGGQRSRYSVKAALIQFPKWKERANNPFPPLTILIHCRLPCLRTTPWSNKRKTCKLYQPVKLSRLGALFYNCHKAALSINIPYFATR